MPSLDLLTPSYDPWVVALSYLIASFASYAALDLARRVRTPHLSVARGWWLSGTIVMGTGVWAMHFVGMLAMDLPIQLGYDYAITCLSWLAAVAASGVALHIASQAELNWKRLAWGALAMGGGICAMHYIGMRALVMAPPILWSALWVGISIVIAVGASAAALLIFFGMRKLQGRQALLGQIGAALLMGAAICGMHYSGMMAASFPGDTICLSADQLGGAGLSAVIGAATGVLLMLATITSMIDAHMQRQTALLEASLKQSNNQLKEQSLRDGLTGLPNRRMLDERLRMAVERSERDRQGFALLFVDLDGFKPVNDSLGHRFGDDVLREMARRLTTQLRAIDAVARVGGDEFVVLLENQADDEAITRIARRILDDVSAPVRGGDDGNLQEVLLSCSIGVARYPRDGAADQLLVQADAAMHAAKRAGGADFTFYEPHMSARARDQLELQRDLRLALTRVGELELYFQPKIDARNGSLTGVEALTRWHHPERGLLGPGIFIPVAERFGLINALGDWVIEQACIQAVAWRNRGQPLAVAVNLSVHQMRQASLAARTGELLKKHGLEPELLSFEVTESVAMEDTAHTLRVFEQLSDIGIQLSIDDFGTGYSSLSYLRQLHADQLKIDQSFVRDLEHRADARAIVQAVVSLAHALGLTVVAEGVETEGQRDILAKLGCDELQGYFYARPMPASTLADWREHQPETPGPSPAQG
jgi:diguanylate cyclase (GGDEF)-like protein